MFHTLMLWYQEIFNPKYFILLCALILAWLDYKSAGGSLKKRFAIILLSWVVVYVIHKTCWWFFSYMPQFVKGYLAVAGVTTGLIVIYLFWRRYNFGYEILGAIVASVALLVPYAIISTFWDISGRIAFTAGPVMYLLPVSKLRFNKIGWLWLLVPVPVIMVINCPVVGAHTVAQSVAGFFLAFATLTGILYYKSYYKLATSRYEKSLNRLTWRPTYEPGCFGRHYSHNGDMDPKECSRCPFEERCKIEELTSPLGLG